MHSKTIAVMKKRILLILTALLVSTTVSNAQLKVRKSYYPGGKVYSRESFVDGIYEGKSQWFYPNGNLKAEKEFSQGKLNGWVRYYYETGIIKEEHHVVNGILDGLSNYYYENGGLKESRNYKNGILVSRHEVEYDSTYQVDLKVQSVVEKKEKNKYESEFLCDADICPEPVGGIKAIEDKLVYPEHAKLYGLEGDVLIVAKIDEKGNVTDVKVAKGIGLGCDEEAKKAVLSVKFIPAQNNGRVVPAEVAFKVKFRLKDKPQFVSRSSPVKTKTTSEDLKKYLSAKPKTDSVVNFVVEKRENKKLTYISCEVDKCPEPEGGLESILEKINYPLLAKRLKIEGKVTVQAKIDRFGYVLDTKVIEGIGYGCDEAAELAILKTKFIPGENKGIPVETQIIVSVPFILSNINKK